MKIIISVVSVLILSIILSPYLWYVWVFKGSLAYYLSLSWMFSFYSVQAIIISIYTSFVLSMYRFFH